MGNSENTRDDDPFDEVPFPRRKAVKIALAASAVAVPVVSSVVLGGVSPALAETPNISGQTTTADPETRPGTTTQSPAQAEQDATTSTTSAPGIQEPTGTTTTTTPTATPTPTGTPTPTTTVPNITTEET